MKKDKRHKNKINPIKYLIGLIMLCSLFSSCDLLFQPEEISISKIENYEQLVDAVGGVYGQFTETVSSVDFFYINYNADDILYSPAVPYRTYYGMQTTTSIAGNISYLDINQTYINLFSTISTINNILSQFNSDKINDKIKQEIIGEIYFLRAYCYYRLVRTYGRIPIVNDDNVNYIEEKPTFNAIYKFIEDDLKMAIAFLPQNIGRHINETPHQGVAKALLAEVYLCWAGYPIKDLSKYQLAASTAKDVIANAEFYGFALLKDFQELWKKNSSITESVFCVKGNLYKGRCEKRFYSEYISIYSYSGFTSDNQYFYGNIEFATEVNFYNNYPKNYRKDITFFNAIYVPDEGNAHYFELDTGYINIDQVEPQSRVCYRKFYIDTALTLDTRFDLGFEDETPNYRYNLKGTPNIYLLRFAQTLLTYAEASARSGELNEKAYEFVNIIRRRANNVDIYSPSEFDLQSGLTVEAFADSVVQERAWELAGEPEGRWFDLLRLEKIEEVISEGSKAEDNFLVYRNKLIDNFIPIPEFDVNLNKNIKSE